MKTLMGAAPDDLRHPGPLTRGADRGACGQHERPVEGPATGTAADPTAGCGVSGDGYGYPDHVGTFLLAKRVLGRLSDPHYKVRWPRGPSRLAKAGRCLILIAPWLRWPSFSLSAPLSLTFSPPPQAVATSQTRIKERTPTPAYRFLRVDRCLSLFFSPLAR